MKSLVLVSHGTFCTELKKSAELILGPQDNIKTVPLLPEEGEPEFTKKFETAIADLDDYVVFADLKGGTPFNIISQRVLKGEKIKLITGMNLPMVIQFINDQMLDMTSDYVQSGKDGIVDLDSLLG